jgi:hypothetical protein
MATNDVYEMAIRQRFRGQQIVNRYHFQANGGFVPTQAQAQTLADAVKEWWRGVQHNTLAYETWTLRQVWGDGVTYRSSRPIRTGGRVYEGTFTGTLTGNWATGTPLPPATALVLQMKTGLVGRRNRGRVYIAGLRVEDLGSDGNVLAGTVSAENTQAIAVLAAYGPGGTVADWDLVVWSFRYASGWKDDPSTPGGLVYVGPISSQNEANGVTSMVCSPIWRVQRRREVGVGT